MNKKILIGILAVSMILIIACSQTPPDTDKTIGRSEDSGKVVAVAIKNFKFAPTDVSKKLGMSDPTYTVTGVATFKLFDDGWRLKELKERRPPD